MALTTRGTTTMMDRPVDGVPENYEKIFAKSGPFIANEVRRRNVVANNFDDLYQTVCERLVAARVIEKFVARVNRSFDDDKPDTITGGEACELLGIDFETWQATQKGYHEVFLGTLHGQIPAADSKEGLVLELCVKDVRATCVISDGKFVVRRGSTIVAQIPESRRAQKYGPTLFSLHGALVRQSVLGPVAGSPHLLQFKKDYAFASLSGAASVLAGTSVGRNGWKVKGAGVTYGAWESGARPVPTGTTNGNHGTVTLPEGEVAWYAWFPTPIEGDFTKQSAVYKTSDVLEIPACNYWPVNFDTSAWPRRKVLPHHFMGYVGRAIHNTWHNFCRTIRRKHRDRTGDCFPQFKTADGDFDLSWEDSLPDENACSPEEVEDAIDYKTIVCEKVKLTDDQTREIGSLLKNHTIVEAVKLSSLTVDQKSMLLSIAGREG